MATIYKLNEYTNKRKEETNMNFTEFQELFDMEYTTKEEFKEMGVQFLDHEQIKWINTITKDINNNLLSHDEADDLFSQFDKFFDTYHTYYDMYKFIRDAYYFKTGIEMITQIEEEISTKEKCSVLDTERNVEQSIEQLEEIYILNNASMAKYWSKSFSYYHWNTFERLTHFKNACIDEFFYQDLFKEHYKSFLPLTELVERKNNRHHIPDAWLKENEEYIPVEVKLNNFNATALRQLIRYMEFYDCKNGVAVGDKLTVELPDNIQFVSNKELTELEKHK